MKTLTIKHNLDNLSDVSCQKTINDGFSIERITLHKNPNLPSTINLTLTAFNYKYIHIQDDYHLDSSLIVKTNRYNTSYYGLKRTPCLGQTTIILNIAKPKTHITLRGSNTNIFHKKIFDSTLKKIQITNQNYISSNRNQYFNEAILKLANEKKPIEKFSDNKDYCIDQPIKTK